MKVGLLVLSRGLVGECLFEVVTFIRHGWDNCQHWKSCWDVYMIVCERIGY